MNNVMSFEERGRAFENKFFVDQEVAFKIEMQTARLVAQWAADRIGFDEVQSAKFISEIGDLVLVEKGTSRVKERLLADFSSNKIDISEHALEKLFNLKKQAATKIYLSGTA